MILRPYSRSCRTASIRSGIAGGLAGKLARAFQLGIAAEAFGAKQRSRGDHSRAAGRPGAAGPCSRAMWFVSVVGHTLTEDNERAVGEELCYSWVVRRAPENSCT